MSKFLIVFSRPKTLQMLEKRKVLSVKDNAVDRLIITAQQFISCYNEILKFFQ